MILSILDAFLGRKPKPPADAVKVSSRTNSDGSTTVTTEFELGQETRPIRDDVVSAFDRALADLGGGVQHAIDPARMLSFMEGGPPIWSVGVVDVPGPRPYALLLTYGFSYELSPESFRAPLHHEYSLAVPIDTPLQPWADALLRHLCRYVLAQGADIRVDDCVPFRGVPMTCIPFQPQHHAMMPNSTLVGVLSAPDPVLGSIDTPEGPVEVRRLVGLDARELACADAWSPRGFREELTKVDPLLLSTLERASYLEQPAFRAIVESRAAAEGRVLR